MSKTNTYELGFLALSHLTQDEVDALQTTLAGEISQAGGQVVSTGDVHYIRLAYEMVKKIGSKNTRHNEAYFSWVKFSVTPDQVSVLDDFARNHKDMLRYMIIMTEADDALTNVFSSLAEEDTEEGDQASTTDEDEEEVLAHEQLPETVQAADDLTKIEGVGPVIATTLENAGILTFAQLRDAPVEQIESYLEGVRGSHDPHTWPEQAALAADEKWEELTELQDKLNGGREE